MSPSDSLIKEILSSPTASHWLKDAVLANLRRDCVDVLNDIDMLSRCMRLRLDDINAASNSLTIREVAPKNV